MADLASASAAKRDGAVARLAIIGARAVGRVLEVATDRTAHASTRAGALRVLEAIADKRALAPAVSATADADASIAVAAIGVLRTFLNDPESPEALDRMTALALDRQRAPSVRVAAIRALLDLDASTVKPILQAISNDPNPEVAGAVRDPRATPTVSPARLLREAAAGSLGDDPDALRRALGDAAGTMTPSNLHQIIERVRMREAAEPQSDRAAWMAARAVAHSALAARGNRLALYDLRETVAAAKGPLPAEYLSALAAIGEVSCLESIAAAYAHAVADKRMDGWWRGQLADAFRAIVIREHITRRSAAVKKMEKRWPGLFESLVHPTA